MNLLLCGANSSLKGKTLLIRDQILLIRDQCDVEYILEAKKLSPKDLTDTAKYKHCFFARYNAHSTQKTLNGKMLE